MADKGLDLDEQYDKIYRYCYLKTHRQEAAEDITQETFLRFLESERYQDTGKALRYLYVIARNLCIDEYRKNTERRTEPFDEEDRREKNSGGVALAGLQPGEKAGDMEARLIMSLTVRKALEELAEEDRELILLRYVNEVPAAVIGRLFGISRFAVYRRTKEALACLKRKLE